ncbi:MAG: tyrosine-type recombinase/integrase [Rubrivivax sp.]|nr:tyrosine-type recombinase/integrase [Rubrivivax sp.]
MGTVIDRNGAFMARVRREGVKAITKTFSTKTAAKAWIRTVEHQIAKGEWQDARAVVPTLAEALKDYRATAGAKLKGAATYSFWYDELAASSLGKLQVSAITSKDIALWRDAQEQTGLQPGTVVRKMGLLSGLLSWCWRERGHITGNPMRGVSKPRVNDARDRTLSDAELSALQAAARTGKAPWLADVLVVLVRSAMRRGELWGLTAADIDFEQSTCHLSDTKNGSARDVPLDPQAREALQRLVQAAQARAQAQGRGRGRGPVVKSDATMAPSAATGAENLRLVPVGDPAAVSLAFRRTVARARRDYVAGCVARGDKSDPAFLADLHLHDCRHQAITTWATAGNMSLPELLAISGHKTPRMLVRYVSLKASDLASKMAGIAAVQAAQQAKNQGVAA